MLNILNISRMLAADAGKNQKQQVIMFVLIGVMLVVMVVMSIIPQRKRKKQQQEMMNALRAGAKVKTIGGFVGEIVAFDEAAGTIIINIGRNDNQVLVTVDRYAVASVIQPTEPAAKTNDGKSVTTENTVAEEEAKNVVMTEDEIEAQKEEEKRAKEKAKKKEEKKKSKERK